MSYNTPPKTTD